MTQSKTCFRCAVHWMTTFVAWCAFVAAARAVEPTPGPGGAVDRPPNIVVVFADDLGYGDVGCFGAQGYQTPNIDRLASEGIRFTDFYVAQAVCSASRTALLTGCYPNRVGIIGALGPDAKVGISDNERTIAEVLRTRGYATAIFGKWHLGHHPRFLPTHHGFDAYFGLPYSNDMWPRHPTVRTFPELPLIEGDKVVQLDPDQHQLTTWYTEHAVKFIDEHREQPFFLYVPHSMPHVPLFVSDKYAGKTERGLFGDVISEVDWSVGQILEALKKHGLDDRTLVIFTSDNGPWLLYGNHAGSSGPLREGKATSFEGGVREPFVARWPGHIPAGRVCREPSMTIDLLPTFAHLAGAEVPSEPSIDGLDITPLLLDKAGAKSPHDAFYFYWGRELQGVRSGRWKLHMPHKYVSVETPGGEGKPGKYVTKTIERSLFDLEADPGETRDVADENPEVVARFESAGRARPGRSGRHGASAGRHGGAPSRSALKRDRAAGSGAESRPLPISWDRAKLRPSAVTARASAAGHSEFVCRLEPSRGVSLETESGQAGIEGGTAASRDVAVAGERRGGAVHGAGGLSLADGRYGALAHRHPDRGHDVRRHRRRRLRAAGAGSRREARLHQDGARLRRHGNRRADGHGRRRDQGDRRRGQVSPAG